MKKRYFWMKLKEDFFDDTKMKILSSLPDGNLMILLYLKMMVKSLKNDGYIFYEGLMNSMFVEVAYVFDVDKNFAEKTINYLGKLGLVQVEKNRIFMSALQENIGSGSKLTAEKTPPKKPLQNSTPDIEKDIKQDTDTDEEKYSNNVYQLIADCFNDTCVSLPKVLRLSDNRKKAIKARLNSYSIDELKSIFKKVEASDFLCGKNSKDWVATFDWIMKDKNMTKILEGNYDNKISSQKSPNPTKTNSVNCSFDLEDLDKLITK